MANHYYGTYPFISWCLSHYFYGGKHYLWVGKPFYPYRAANPVSSNAYRIFGELYEIAKENDHHRKGVLEWRYGFKTAVHLQIRNDSDLLTRLFLICEKIHTKFFFPIVYRIDVDKVPEDKLLVAGSGAEVGSNEYLIESIEASDFEIMFADFEHDTLRQLWQKKLNPQAVLKILEANSQ